MADEVSNNMHGRVLAQRYRLIDKLGEGGMGSVWRAEHLELGTWVAVKLISQEVATNPEALARFRREAHAAAALRSPHVVQILDYGVDGDTPFMVMELLDGESLADRLARRGSLGLPETSKILSQVARAVSKAHSFGIVHRDLKPDNIFLVNNDDEEVAKVLDFGIAKATGGATGSANMMTGTGVMLGTPFYMSPEQASGKREVDHRTDTWALAVIAYQCMVGEPPFRGETIGGLVLAICTEEAPRPSQHAAVDPAFDLWFSRGVQRDPEQRFQSARDLAESLRALAGGLGVPEAVAYQASVSGAFGASAPRSAPGGLVSPSAPMRGGPVSTTAQNTSMTQSVLDRPAPKRSSVPLLLLVFVPLLAGGGYVAYRNLRVAAAPASPTSASEPALTGARPIETEPKAQPRSTERPNPAPAPNSEPAFPPNTDPVLDVAPVAAERPESPAKIRSSKASPAKAVAPKKPAAPEPPKAAAAAAKPAAPPPKPADKSKIDLAF